MSPSGGGGMFTLGASSSHSGDVVTKRSTMPTATSAATPSTSMVASPPSGRVAVFRPGPVTGVRYPPPSRPPNDRDRHHHAVPSDSNQPTATPTDPGDRKSTRLNSSH